MNKLAYTLVLSLSSMLYASAYYDASTVGSSVITTPSYSTPSTMILPLINTPTLGEGIVEAKSFAEATGRRFSVKLSKNNLRSRKPFFFRGGNIHSFAKAIRRCDLFADVHENTVSVYEIKKIVFPLESTNSKYVNQLKRDISSISGISNLRLNRRSKKISFTGTQSALSSAFVLVEGYNNMIKTEKLKKCYAKIAKANAAMLKKALPKVTKSSGNAVATPVSPVNNPVPKTSASSYPVIPNSATPAKTAVSNQKIILDRPYTIRSIIHKLSERDKKKYKVMIDGNIPVDKGVSIGKIEDLNKYLQRSTGRFLLIRKKKNGTIIVDAKGGK